MLQDCGLWVWAVEGGGLWDRLGLPLGLGLPTWTFLGHLSPPALPHPAGLTSRPRNFQRKISSHLGQGKHLNAGTSHLQMGKARPRVELAQSKVG